MMRRALVVGIDEYRTSSLRYCVHDAERMTHVLARNADGSPNFDCRSLYTPPGSLDRRGLAQAVDELFATEADAAIFYFSGHGAADASGGYLITSEAETCADGYPMHDLLARATGSRVREVVVILDCCYSGQFGNLPEMGMNRAVLREGVAILAASRSYESALESDGGGVFTRLIVDALDGGAADVLGRVTVGSVYSYVDMALSAWDQRPVFKAHLMQFTPLRKCEPHVDAAILRLLTRYFERPDQVYNLDPSYEPDLEPKDERNERTFAHLQKLRDARLLVPVGEEHLYYAAVNSRGCKLTALGQFYWRLADLGRI